MIVVLNCSTSWSESKHCISSTGEFSAIPEDSVLIDIETLKLANAKLIELKYEKEINDSLRSIIVKDDELINLYNNQVNGLKEQVKQEKRKFNIASGIGIGTSILLVVLLIIK